MHTPLNLILALQKISSARSFVETGTYLGDTCDWASRHFDQVHSIELSTAHYANAKTRFASTPSVTLHQGRSEHHLAEIAANLQGLAIFWLDAHWSGPGTDGEDIECPILDEIKAIDLVLDDHILLIDDADYFFRPPPPPHKAGHWPLLPCIFDVLRVKDPEVLIVIVKNVIVKVPGRFAAELLFAINDVEKD